MKRAHRVLLPPSFASGLSAEDRRRLDQLQAGLVAHLDAAALDDEAIAPDPWQTTADLAQWYLVIATEKSAVSVSVDVDRCAFLLGEAAERGCLPSRDGVAALQQRWLATGGWPCLPGDEAPPLLRGG